MLKWIFTRIVCAGTATLMLCSCENLPGTRAQQGTVIGGAAGAATGAVVAGSEHRALGALLGGLLGAGGGYVIAANTDKVKNHDNAGAAAAMKNAQTNPATPSQALTATTADLNGDGFVTLDEVVAMKNAGLSDQKMLDMMRASGHVFELTPEQKNYLTKNGVSENIVNQMSTLNQSTSGIAPKSTSPQSPSPSDVISQPPATR